MKKLNHNIKNIDRIVNLILINEILKILIGINSKKIYTKSI